jgi:ankyrin repeat protein
MCKRYPKFREARNTFGETPLMQAVSWGRKKSVVALLESGAQIQVVNDVGMSPLHDAAAEGQTACLSLLLNRGCRKDLRDKGGVDSTRLGYEQR